MNRRSSIENRSSLTWFGVVGWTASASTSVFTLVALSLAQPVLRTIRPAVALPFRFGDYFLSILLSGLSLWIGVFPDPTLFRWAISCCSALIGHYSLVSGRGPTLFNKMSLALLYAVIAVTPFVPTVLFVRVRLRFSRIFDFCYIFCN